MKTICDLSPAQPDNKEFELCVIPVSKNKIPYQRWEEFQHSISPVSYWHKHFRSGKTVGVITGKISGGLEVIDIDIKHDPAKTIYDEFIGQLPLELIKKLIIQTTPTEGYHLIYRCDPAVIQGNQKLAHHSDKRVIIETRGEGGYFCTSQTKYKIIQGVFDLGNLNVDIPEITPDERNLLLETARSLTRYFPDNKQGTTSNYKYRHSSINDFNEGFDIINLFEAHSWQVVNQGDIKVLLRRPGSLAHHSGTYFSDTKTFFCFSSSTDFEPEKPYNHFQVLQVLENIPDYNKALKKLGELGYPTDTPQSQNPSSDDIAEYLNNMGVRYDTFIQEVTLNGNPLDEIEGNTLYLDYKKQLKSSIPRSQFEDVIKSRYIESMDTVREFIEKNRERKPKNTIEEWASGIELVDESIDRKTVIHFLRKWYVGLIAQALGERFPNEFFLALLSVEEGIGKTTFLREYVLPEPLRKYVAEHSLSFDEDFKVLMGNSILIIDDEMDGRTYNSQQTFKSILSQKEMTTRRKYDRRMSKIQRRCSFAGSGNNLNVIRGNTNRRIIPIEVRSFNWERLDNLDYTDLFMEAYYLYEGMMHYSYESKDKPLLQTLYMNYIQETDVQVLLKEYVNQPTGEDLIFISVLDITNILCNKFPNFSKRINTVIIGKTLTEMGFKPVRKNKNRTPGYYISKASRIFEEGEFICDK